jgi:hypothetical protein
MKAEVPRGAKASFHVDGFCKFLVEQLYANKCGKLQ